MAKQPQFTPRYQSLQDAQATAQLPLPPLPTSLINFRPVPAVTSAAATASGLRKGQLLLAQQQQQQPQPNQPQQQLEQSNQQQQPQQQLTQPELQQQPTQPQQQQPTQPQQHPNQQQTRQAKAAPEPPLPPSKKPLRKQAAAAAAATAAPHACVELGPPPAAAQPPLTNPVPETVAPLQAARPPLPSADTTTTAAGEKGSRKRGRPPTHPKTETGEQAAQANGQKGDGSGLIGSSAVQGAMDNSTSTSSCSLGVKKGAQGHMTAAAASLSDSDAVNNADNNDLNNHNHSNNASNDHSNGNNSNSVSAQDGQKGGRKRGGAGVRGVNADNTAGGRGGNAASNKRARQQDNGNASVCTGHTSGVNNGVGVPGQLSAPEQLRRPVQQLKQQPTQPSKMSAQQRAQAAQQRAPSHLKQQTAVPSSQQPASQTDHSKQSLVISQTEQQGPYSQAWQAAHPSVPPPATLAHNKGAARCLPLGLLAREVCVCVFDLVCVHMLCV